MLYALRGTPFVFQGEELGPARRRDPAGPRRRRRRPRPRAGADPVAAAVGGRARARASRPATPWLPIVADAEQLCVEARRRIRGRTLHFTRRLLALRATTPALQGGSQRALDTGPELFCFLRELGDERLLVALNFGSRRARVRLGGGRGRRPAVDSPRARARRPGPGEARTRAGRRPVAEDLTRAAHTLL